MPLMMLMLAMWLTIAGNDGEQMGEKGKKEGPFGPKSQYGKQMSNRALVGVVFEIQPALPQNFPAPMGPATSRS